MRTLLAFFLFFIFTGSAYAEPWNETPEWKFIQEINFLEFQCRMKVQVDDTRHKYESNLAREAPACFREARPKANQAFKTIYDKTTYKPEIKSIFAQWNGFALSETPDKYVESAYNQSVELLRVDLMTQ